MNFKRLIYSNIGRMVISILLGLGLASLFRRVCRDKSCIKFNGPIISMENDKIYKFNEKCYKYTYEPNKCNEAKRILPFAEKPIE